MRNETNPLFSNSPATSRIQKNVRNARQEDKLATPARDGWRAFLVDADAASWFETVKMREEIACFFMDCLLRKIYEFYRFSFNH